jgi:glycosyltransferase involved in cell wall biosynthesis
MTCPTKYSPLNIAFIIDEIGVSTAGTEKHLLSLINSLSRSSFKPFLVVLRSSEYLRNNPTSCPSHVLGIQKLFSCKSIKQGVKLCIFLRENSISIAHIFFNDSSIFAPFFCKLARSKVILSRRDLGFNYTPKQLLLLKLNRLFIDYVIVNSKAVKKIVCTKERWASVKKVKVIHNGVNFKKLMKVVPSGLRSQLNIPPKAHIVGIVANLNPWKRHEDLIEAFCYVHDKKPESQLVIVGDGILEESLRKKAENLGLKQAVHFLGALENVIPVVQEFSVGVLCSETEGFSNAILEYMACGKPVVATITGGNVEIIEHGINGFLVPVGDIKSLAFRILTLLNDKAIRHKFGNAGIYKVQSEFAFEKMVEAHLALYEELVDYPSA